MVTLNMKLSYQVRIYFLKCSIVASYYEGISSIWFFSLYDEDFGVVILLLRNENKSDCHKLRIKKPFSKEKKIKKEKDIDPTIKGITF